MAHQSRVRFRKEDENVKVRVMWGIRPTCNQSLAIAVVPLCEVVEKKEHVVLPGGAIQRYPFDPSPYTALQVVRQTHGYLVSLVSQRASQFNTDSL